MPTLLNEQQQHTLSLFCETLFYGVFCVAIATVVHIWINTKRLTLSRKVLFSTSILLFLLATVHMAMELFSVYTLDDPINVTQASATVAILAGFLGDLILIWRVWIVWARRWWIVVIPFLASFTGFIIGIISAAVLTSPNQLNNLLPIPTASLALTGTSVNTFLIVGRLVYQQWKTNSIMGSSSSNYFKGVILLVLESGAVLVSANITALVLEKLNNPAAHVVLNAIMPLLGLVPTVIIVLVHLDLAVGNHTTKRYTETLSALRFGDNPKRRPNRAVDSTTTDSLNTIEQSREHAPVRIVREQTNDSAEIEEKTSAGVQELLNFASSGGMV